MCNLPHSSRDTYGIVLRPMRQDEAPDVLAKHMYNLLSAIGIRGTDIKYIMVSPQGAYAKVGLVNQDLEEYALKVFREASLVMNRYDLRTITAKPQLLYVEKLDTTAVEFDNEQKHYPAQPTSAKSLMPTSSDTKLQTQQAVGKSPQQAHKSEAVGTSPQQAHTSAGPPRDLNVHNGSSKGKYQSVTIIKSTSESQIPRSPKLPARTPNTPEPVTDTTDIRKPAPILVSTKTSTPVFQPCDCPETVFYHHLQNIGTETRHAEFKKGGVIFDKKSFRAIIGKYICGFLNSEGGTIFFGVSDSGVVLGVDVSAELEHSLRKEIAFTARLIEPHVSSHEYSVNFARIMDQTGELSGDLKVLELCVRPREPPQKLYSYKDIIYMRRDGSLQTLGHIENYIH